MATHHPTEFSVLLRTLRERSGKSRYWLAQFSGVNQAYLLRLERGERRNPTRDTVLKLALALVAGSSLVTIDDVNELLWAATYVPLLGRGQSFASH